MSGGASAAPRRKEELPSKGTPSNIGIPGARAFREVGVIVSGGELTLIISAAGVM